MEGSAKLGLDSASGDRQTEVSRLGLPPVTDTKLQGSTILRSLNLNFDAQIPCAPNRKAEACCPEKPCDNPARLIRENGETP
jgi:hypothetical protein